LAARQLRVKAGADFQQAGQPAAQLDPAARGLRDPGQDFEQGRFTRPVAADDANDFPRLDVEADVLEGPEIFLNAGFAPVAPAPDRGADQIGERLAQGAIARRRGPVTHAITFAQTSNANGRLHAPLTSTNGLGAPGSDPCAHSL